MKGIDKGKAKENLGSQHYLGHTLFLNVYYFYGIFWNSAIWLEIISSDIFITITNEFPPISLNLLSRYVTIIITIIAVVKLWETLLGVFGPDYEIKLLIECCRREAGKIIKSKDQTSATR